MQINAVIYAGKKTKKHKTSKPSCSIPIQFSIRFDQKRHQSPHTDAASCESLVHCVWSCLVWAFSLLCRSLFFAYIIYYPFLRHIKVTQRTPEVSFFFFFQRLFSFPRHGSRLFFLCLSCLYHVLQTVKTTGAPQQSLQSVSLQLGPKWTCSYLTINSAPALQAQSGSAHTIGKWEQRVVIDHARMSYMTVMSSV